MIWGFAVLFCVGYCIFLHKGTRAGGEMGVQFSESAQTSTAHSGCHLAYQEGGGPFPPEPGSLDCKRGFI